MAVESNIEKLQQLLREIFQFECAELDFGIYRIMNHKREAIEKFIMRDLPAAVSAELASGAIADQSAAAEQLKEVSEQICETLGEPALNGDGSLAEAYQDTPLGRRYLQLLNRAAGARARGALEALIFNHLHTFFSRYYDNGDFLSKRRYSRKQKYAVPYNGEEVYLHWANSDQYYIKTAEHFTDYSYRAAGLTVHFRMRAADVEKDNVKGDRRFFLPVTSDATFDAKGMELVIPFEYRPLTAQEDIGYGRRNQQDAIIAEAADELPKRFKDANALAALLGERRKTADGGSVSFLEHHLRRYTRRNTSDFFIHKDLKGFLERELDFYIKNEVLNVDEIEAGGEERAEGWFQVMHGLKAVGARLIAFLAQIEDFQKRLFEKKKFITETQYCITVGNIPEEFHPEIAVCDAQWAEWRGLFHVDKEQRNLFTAAPNTQNGRRLAFLKAHPTLVLDTKHFGQGFVDRLLGTFENLDQVTDGLLIHGESFQAIGLLLAKYRERVKCIYIDPPFNTGGSSFIYKNGYQRSSWMSMIANSVSMGMKLLGRDGVNMTAIDDFELFDLGLVLDRLFGEGGRLGLLVVENKPSGRTNDMFLATCHEYYLCHGTNAASVGINFGSSSFWRIARQGFLA